MGTYMNAMETLVEREVERQVQALPERVVAYVNKTELSAYALNQLPSLYATSEKGLAYQIQRGQSKHGAQVREAVQRALIAIQRDPIRRNAPLTDARSPLMQDILRRLQSLLKNEQLNWEMLPQAVEQALKAVARAATPATATAAPAHHPSPYLRRYSTIPASSPFPEMPVPETPSLPPAPAPSAARPVPTASHRPGAAVPRTPRASQDSAPSDGVYGWDDPFNRD